MVGSALPKAVGRLSRGGRSGNARRLIFPTPTKGFKFIDNIFDTKHQDLATIYKKWGRCLVVTDDKINKMYGEQLKAYFDHHGIALTVHTFPGGELYKVSKTGRYPIRRIDARDRH